MKTWKKLFAVLVVFSMLFAFTACGGKDLSASPYVGTWEATTAAYLGMEMSVESLLGGAFVFELRDNGKCVMTIAGEESYGKWEETEHGFLIEGELEAVVDGETAVMDYDGVTLSFEHKTLAKGDTEPQATSDAPKVQKAQQPQPTQQTSEPQGFWEGDWYGWYILESCSGDYEGLDGYAFDCCASIVRSADDTGRIEIWDDEFSRSDPMISVDVTFGDGTTEDGAMMSENGYFLDCEIGHADWIVDAGLVYPETSASEKPLWINGTYIESDNPDNTLQYSIYLRPWGADWDELIAEDPEFWSPVHYEDWYLPMISSGASMPDTLVFGEGEADSAEPASSENLGIVDLETLKAAYVWIDETMHTVDANNMYILPSYEEIVAHMNGVEGRPYYPDSWTDTQQDYIWVTPDYVQSEKGDRILCGFRVNEDGTLAMFSVSPSLGVKE